MTLLGSGPPTHPMSSPSLSIAALIPTTGELESFISAMESLGAHGVPGSIGRIPCLSFRDGRLLVAQGGLGKVDFAIRTLHILELQKTLDAVVCLGTCGALSPDLAIGDVVIATETVEHDFNRKLTEGPIPRFESDRTLMNAFKSAQNFLRDDISVTYGPIASGDEGIDSSARARELIERTGGIVAAWEGAGGAKACAFAEVPYIEIRCVSDLADEDADTDFRENTPLAMENLAELMLSLR